MSATLPMPPEQPVRRRGETAANEAIVLVAPAQW